MPLPIVLDYFLELKNSGLSLSSIRVHLEAVNAFQDKIDGFLTFTHLIMKCFLVGLQNLYPKVHSPTSTWDLNLVLKGLMIPTFEPLVTCSLQHMSMKVAFLVAITSAR